jgi:hypothetical protein
LVIPHSSLNRGYVEPLGVFGGNKAPETFERLLRPLIGEMPVEVRERVVDYLRSATMVQAWMSYTRDVLEDRFGVAGGSAIRSDGVYYWRNDAAEYIENYGIGLPTVVVEHMRSSNWTPRRLDEEEERLVDAFLMTRPRTGQTGL